MIEVRCERCKGLIEVDVDDDNYNEHEYYVYGIHKVILLKGLTKKEYDESDDSAKDEREMIKLLCRDCYNYVKSGIIRLVKDKGRY